MSFDLKPVAFCWLSERGVLKTQGCGNWCVLFPPPDTAVCERDADDARTLSDRLCPRVEGRRPVERRAAARARCGRSEEHTSELQSLMRTSYAVFCLKKKNSNPPNDLTVSPNPIKHRNRRYRKGPNNTRLSYLSPTPLNSTSLSGQYS